MNKLRCLLTHSQIVFGNCPLCGMLVKNDNTNLGGGEISRPVTWDTGKVIDDLKSNDQIVRLLTAMNLKHLDPTVKEALTVFRVALNARDERVTQTAVEALLFKGRELTLPMALEYESILNDDPTEVSVRLVLLGFYGKVRFSSKTYEDDWARHVGWLITNAPYLPISMGYMILDPERHPGIFVKARQEWMDRVVNSEGNVEVIEKAADFLGPRDFDKSEELLRKARTLDPLNSKWDRKLGQLFMLKLLTKSGDQEKETGLRSILEFERALGKASEDEERMLLCDLLSQVALKIGETDKAQFYANELLRQQPEPKDSLDKRFRHDANTILGMVALRSGNKEAAISHLAEAGKCLAGTFPLILTLARELLEVGETRAVIDYLRHCAPFLDKSKHQAEQWIHAIEMGEMPDFGPNGGFL
jgi:tetratricopeptide (TPR) repeat protein